MAPTKRQELVEEARQRNALYDQAGSVRLQTLYHYRDQSAPSKRWRELPGFRNVSVCQGAKKWKALAPRFLGPLVFDGVPAVNLANVWTYSQVTAQDLRNGAIKPEWFEHRRWGFGQPDKKRSAQQTPLFWLWEGGAQLDLVQARKAYCALYARLVQAKDEYRELHLLVQQGYNLQLFGYDAWDFTEQGKTLLQAIEDPTARFGHELVLYGLLTGQRVWD
jgi:hypothetical protein